ncbi:MAG: AGE family epimerase/isomerase [Alicyclobacillus sp.]|nr:AGE family epimerase/isomerase [Alicyclobacillus sp.]
MRSSHMSSLLQRVEREGHNILRYWRDNVILPNGDFRGVISGDGEIQQDAPRGIILAARILWTFSRAVTSGFADIPEHRAIADGAYQTLQSRFWDPEHLGFYWMVDAAWQPLQPFKHVYAQAFAIYALSEYAAMTGRQDALRLAQLTTLLVEQHAADPVHGGYYESFIRDWSADTDFAHAPVNHGGPKSMNSHLHILEAYTRLYQVWPNAWLRTRLEALLDVMRQHIVNPANKHYYLYFQADWTATGNVVSYGHDIEGSWLMHEAAVVLGDPDRIRECEQLAVEMVDAVLAEGLDADGGLMSEGLEGKIVDGDKEWWQQAEAVVGCVNAYQITGKADYLHAAEKIWAFIERCVIDQAGGEWWSKVRRDGSAIRTMPKVSAWKCPYHNTRACIELFLRGRSQE